MVASMTVLLCAIDFPMVVYRPTLGGWTDVRVARSDDGRSSRWLPPPSFSAHALRLLMIHFGSRIALADDLSMPPNYA
jgi:hypothetical protein